LSHGLYLFKIIIILAKDSPAEISMIMPNKPAIYHSKKVQGYLPYLHQPKSGNFTTTDKDSGWQITTWEQ